MDKKSPCCNAILMPYISLNKKQCVECMKWHQWHLDEGQAPIFDGKR